MAKLPKNFQSKILEWKYNKFWTQFKLSEQPKIDNVNILFIPSGFVPFSFIKNYKLITVIHDLCFLKYPELYSKKELILQKLSLKLSILLSKKIITVSNYTKYQILNYVNCTFDKIQPVYLGYNNNYKKINDKKTLNKVKRRYNLPENFILFIGRKEKKKNLINQIKAFKKFNEKYPNFYFVIVGKEGYGYEKIHKEIAGNDKILELGWVKQNDLPCILNLAKTLMFSSYYEGFGIPALEAFACGCPLITSSTTSMPEIADNSALFNDPNDVSGIYKNLVTLVKNKNHIRDELIKRGFGRAKQFSWDKCAKETIAVFESVLNKKPH